MQDTSTFVSTKTPYPGGLFRLRDYSHQTMDRLGYSLDDTVLHATPLGQVDPAMLFTYMHRRFGLPNVGGDPYKDLTAAWLLSTPRDDVYLRVQPSLVGAGFSFEPLFRPPENTTSVDDMDEGLLDAFVEAYRRTLVDLLRPSIQRDIDFNALGKIDADNIVPEDLNEGETETSYHASCGHPMPVGLFAEGAWVRFLRMMIAEHEAAADGVSLLVEDRTKAVLSELRAADELTRVLVAAGLRLSRGDDAATVADEVLEGFPEDAVRCDEFVSARYGKTDIPGWIAAIDQSGVESAETAIRRLGFSSTELDKGYRDICRHVLLGKAWTDLCALEGPDFEFDYTWVPDDKFPHYGTAERMLENVRAAGADSVTAWAESLSSEEHGSWVLTRIIEVLWDQKRKAEPEAAEPPAP